MAYVSVSPAPCLANQDADTEDVCRYSEVVITISSLTTVDFSLR